MASSVLTASFVYLLARWIPRLKSRLATVPAPFAEATHVLVVNSFEQTELLLVSRQRLAGASGPLRRFLHPDAKGRPTVLISIDYRRNRFVLDRQTGLFVSVTDLVTRCLPESFDSFKGATEAEHDLIASFLGQNLIDIEERSALQIFCNEILHPFYVFQVASFFIWISEDYELYALVILAMATGSALLTVLETKRNLDKMRQMAKFSCPVRVIREDRVRSCSSCDLVPGDLLLLEDSLSILPCDGIIINGDALVDESMLTGETVPVSKASINFEAYQAILADAAEEDPRTCIYSGTKLLRARARYGRPAMLLVTRTGFLTLKGSLVQSILFPRPNKFRFYRDSMLFIAILSLIAALGFSVAIYNFMLLGVGLYWIIVRALDVITVVVPPALPTTMAIGTVFAIKRLERQQIYCISPPRINVSSKVQVFCFDKTGTLTEEGLVVYGILPVSAPEPDQLVAGVPASPLPSFCHLAETLQDLEPGQRIKEITPLLASCHGLRRINGRLMGDSLDFYMFEFSRWQLEELHDVSEAFVPTIVRAPPEVAAHLSVAELGIIRQFDFSVKLRRMSVIVRSPEGKHCVVYCKGSPESLLEVCLPASLPKNYTEVLSYYAHHGYRVIACASKTLPPTASWLRAQRMDREEAESSLTFLGFIIFENRVKPLTKNTIDALRLANVKSIMATGDNILTAISVGRASGIVPESALVYYPSLFLDAKSPREITWRCVDEVARWLFDPVQLAPVCTEGASNLGVGYRRQPFSLAISGEFFEWIYESLPREFLLAIVARCSIYARMSPQQKQLLVEVLQKHCRTVVGFCGDGANDCGALKAADVGVSLSQAEASIAAPFTSKVQDITCIPILLREGRASLVTSFCCFKYMTLYSMIQFTTLIFLYSFGSTLSDGQFIYVDLLLIIPLGILMSRYAPSKSLSADQPTAKLISPPMLICILGHIALQAAAQALVYRRYAHALTLGWVPPFEDETQTFHPATSVMFLFSTFQYLIMALIFSVGRPFRQRIYWPFFIYSAVGIVTTVMTLLAAPQWLLNWLYITDLPLQTRLAILNAAGIYLVLAFLLDRLLVPLVVKVMERRSKALVNGPGGSFFLECAF